MAQALFAVLKPWPLLDFVPGSSVMLDIINFTHLHKCDALERGRMMNEISSALDITLGKVHGWDYSVGVKRHSPFIELMTPELRTISIQLRGHDERVPEIQIEFGRKGSHRTAKKLLRNLLAVEFPEAVRKPIDMVTVWGPQVTAHGDPQISGNLTRALSALEQSDE